MQKANMQKFDDKCGKMQGKSGKALLLLLLLLLLLSSHRQQSQVKSSSL